MRGIYYSTRQKKVANTVYRFAVLMLTVCPFPFRFQRRSVLPFYRSVLPFYRFTVPFCRFTRFIRATERAETAGECLKVHTESR